MQTTTHPTAITDTVRALDADTGQIVAIPLNELAFEMVPRTLPGEPGPVWVDARLLRSTLCMPKNRLSSCSRRRIADLAAAFTDSWPRSLSDWEYDFRCEDHLQDALAEYEWMAEVFATQVTQYGYGVTEGQDVLHALLACRAGGYAYAPFNLNLKALSLERAEQVIEHYYGFPSTWDSPECELLLPRGIEGERILPISTFTTPNGIRSLPFMEAVVAYDVGTGRSMIVRGEAMIRREMNGPIRTVSAASVRVDSRSRQLRRLRAILERYPYQPTSPAG
jgi:hypothetical protein